VAETAQVHVRVDHERKERWRKHAEDDPENPNGSLTQLVVRAVENEIAGRHDGGDTGGSVSVDLSEITDRQATTEKEVAQLRDTLGDVASQVEDVRRAVTSDTEKRSLEERLWEALPPAKPKTKSHALAESEDPHSVHTYRVAWSGKISDICVRVGETPDRVAEKLDEMGVPRGEVDGETRYWMEDTA
jgi:hypothetical protein